MPKLSKIRKDAEQKREQSQIEKHLRSALKKAQNDNAALQRKLGNQELIIGEVCSAVDSLPNERGPRRKQSKAKPNIGVVLKLGDWHIGDRIRKEETGGRNEYSLAIAKRRLLDTIVPNMVKWVEGNRNAYNIPKLHVFGEGDYVSGDIHPELMVSNEFPTPVATAHAGDLMAEAIQMLAKHFDEVEVVAVGGGNHDRLTRKTQSKGRTLNSWGYLVHHIAQARLERQKNVKFRIQEDFRQEVTINGKTFLIEHGDSIRGQLGIPYYGMKRLAGMEALNRINSGEAYHYHSIGHFHHFAVVEDKFIINQSLCGGTEYDRTCGRNGKPGQVAFMVSKHGMFNITPFGEEL
jgi:hypothetical protein